MENIVNQSGLLRKRGRPAGKNRVPLSMVSVFLYFMFTNLFVPIWHAIIINTIPSYICAITLSLGIFKQCMRCHTVLIVIAMFVNIIKLYVSE